MKKIIHINKKYEELVFGILMSAAMASSITLVYTVMNVGVQQNFLSTYTRAVLISFLIGYPISRVVIRLVRRVMTTLFDGAQ